MCLNLELLLSLVTLHTSYLASWGPGLRLMLLVMLVRSPPLVKLSPYLLFPELAPLRVPMVCRSRWLFKRVCFDVIINVIVTCKWLCVPVCVSIMSKEELSAVRFDCFINNLRNSCKTHDRHTVTQSTLKIPVWIKFQIGDFKRLLCVEVQVLFYFCCCCCILYPSCGTGDWTQDLLCSKESELPCF